MRTVMQAPDGPFLVSSGQLRNYGDRITLEGPGATATVAGMFPASWAGVEIQIKVGTGQAEGFYIGGSVLPPFLIPAGGLNLALPVFSAWVTVTLEVVKPRVGAPVLTEDAPASIVGWTGATSSGSSQG